ncbi:M1 family metallopeptidase [Sphingomonas solaris]|uniref:Aminopeptidase n=1 Tax=Alterirhizorhabdus solaris TaxID=2529389 RepID=A0A558QZL1_9SPHN|nr:M1 family metallopeptidase [Sphingomonas solaris]TVV72559.1 M1 family metallopeptidase [Sphingomonas solaris]
MRRSVLLAAPLLLSLGGAAPGLAPGQLPANVTPIHYDITVDPDAKALSFTGSEVVTIAVASPTRTITLNAADLTIGAVRLDDATTPTVKLDSAKQTLTLAFPSPVTAGTHKLSIAYAGKINRSAAGMFAVDYKNARGGDERMLVTQFEPADGRRFAPMWDEPSRKATFRLTAATPEGNTAFSNMPVAGKAKGANGKTLVTFATTPKMSSYLLFLGMGDVERRTKMVGNTEIGIITRRGAIDQGDYALESAARLLAYYNDYFGTPYPLPKMDMIAAPGSSQFFSAMENWGAILYFDRVLLLDPKVSSENDRQRIFTVVAHEMAHQWFGDLVTMAWWDDLWLNEGFASWMEGKASHELNPGWNKAAQDVAFERERAMAADARSSTHAIVQPIGTVDEISQAFDAITYAKGQAVIGMIEGALGPDPFRDGVRRYMAKYKYGNTRTDQLWAELAASAGRPVKPFADTFTLQGGVPLIRGGEPACAGGNTRITFSQDRFGLDPASKARRRWIVPVRVAGGNAMAKLDVSGPGVRPATVRGCVSPVVVNPGQQGYYRFLAAPGHFKALSDGFAGLVLTDQVGLMGDTLALANGNYLPFDRYLGLLDKIPATADPLVWNLAAAQLVRLDRVLAGDPAQRPFRARAAAMLAPQYDRVGFAPKRGEAPPVSQLREVLIVALGRFGYAPVADAARKAVAGGLDDIPAATRNAVLATYALNATPADWDKLHALALAERNPIARSDLYAALAGSADAALAQRALDLALTEEPTTPDRAELIAGVSAEHPALAFDFAVAHAAQVNAFVEASSRPRYIVRLATTSADPALADRVERYAATSVPAGSRQTATDAVTTIRYRARLRAEQAAPIAAWAGRATNGS